MTTYYLIRITSGFLSLLTKAGRLQSQHLHLTSLYLGLIFATHSSTMTLVYLIFAIFSCKNPIVINLNLRQLLYSESLRVFSLLNYLAYWRCVCCACRSLGTTRYKVLISTLCAKFLSNQPTEVNRLQKSASAQVITVRWMYRVQFSFNLSVIHLSTTSHFSTMFPQQS